MNQLKSYRKRNSVNEQFIPRKFTKEKRLTSKMSNKTTEFVKTGYIRTFKNRKFCFDDLDNNVYDIEDIAHSLSMQCRWTGHTKVFYSIAEHSSLMFDALPDEYKLEGLLHDASEAWLTDLSRPVKAYVPEYRKLQHRVEAAVAKAFNVPFPMSEPVKKLDDAMLKTEWEQLFDRTDIYIGLDLKPAEGVFIQGWNWMKAEDEFLKRYYSIAG